MLRLALLATLLIPVAAGAETMRVGMVTRDFADPVRLNWTASGPRPLRTAIWYPAEGTADEAELVGRPYFDLPPVATAPPLSSARQRYPLIVLSHGTGGSAIQMMWLGHELARRGYIAAAVNHHGNTSAERDPMPHGFLLYWERALDLTSVLNALLEDPLLVGRIDVERIGAAGFSLGGYTVLAAAGAVFSPKQFSAFCASPERDFTCEPQPEFSDAPRQFAEQRRTDPLIKQSLSRATRSYRDPRISAVFVIAPALGSGLTKRSLRRIAAPVHIVVGEADTITPARTNAHLIARSIPAAELTTLRGPIGHYTFLAPCTAEGRTSLPICRDAAEVRRGEIHHHVATLAWRFFENVFD